MTNPVLSVVSPVYRAEKIVDELVHRIREEASVITDDFEIILVEDGGPDNSWEKIEENCRKDPRVKGIKLSRNFGQHFAITAGLDFAAGDYVIVMDCDLQDNPRYIPQLVGLGRQGFDVVYTMKEERRHGFLKNILTNLFNMVFNFLIENRDWKAHKNVGSYSLLSKKVVHAFRNVHDYQRHYLMVLRWLGFKSTFLQIEHESRFEGKSSYNISKLLIHAINGITSQSDKLLRINVVAGVFISLLAFISILLIVFLYFTRGFLSGWASLIVTLLFSTGVLLTSIGIAGIYIGKTFEQVKNRPKYIIDKIV
jgi:glycosyltransferase involved in cell wall biosynthesis